MRSRSRHDELIRVIRAVRRRWRLRVALRGLAIVLGAGLLVFLISAFGMDRLRFSPGGVVVFRAFAYVALGLLALRFLVWPLSRRLSDERVALYLEEHEPSLEARVLSAVEFGAGTDDSAVYSPGLVRGLVESAVERCAAIDYGRRVEAGRLSRSAAMLAVSMIALLAAFIFSPPFLHHSKPFLLPLGNAAVVNPYRIDVEPGNARVARGGELKVTARLLNFQAESVELAAQRGPEREWERFPMSLDEETGSYEFFLFELNEETEYFVESSGVRSGLFRIEVADLPYVADLVLEYHFPAYTGLEPQRRDGGDIAALRGTEVQALVTPTVPVARGSIALESGDSIALALEPDGRLSGALRVNRDDAYRIVLETADGERIVGSPDYLIDVLTDQPPWLVFKKPGRDIKVTNIEEVFTEVEAEDDYGVHRLELIFSVNGSAEQTVELYRGRGTRRQLTAGHTLYLEEYELVPGDFISYYARATDNNRGSGRQVTTTDIYFMEVRRFDREYRQADQAGGAAGAGGFDSSLSRRQRDVIAATFNVIRDRERYSTKGYAENLATLALAQGKLREDVETLLARLRARGIVQMDDRFRMIAQALPKAAEAMREAEERLGEREPDEALAPEQRALQQLQRAESAFREVQVARGEPGGGGAGQPDAEELAELFELELDKQRNQYERVQRDQGQQVDQQLDETLQKLQELARRQQQETERRRARAGQSSGQAGRGGAAQRELAEEAEELARKLERLARERSRPELNRTARELRQAAEEMRRASSGSRERGVAEGLSALERLREARRTLDQSRSQGLKRDVEDALERAKRLAEEQRDVASEVDRLAETDRNRGERLRRLIERKEEMAEEVKDLEAQLDRLARESRREQRDASRRLQEAAKTIRDGKLEDKIRYSRGVVQQRSAEYARNFEQQISGDIEALREKLETAREAIGESKEQRLGRALDRARDLTRSLESLEERIEEGSSGRRTEPEAAGESQPGGEARGDARIADATVDGFPGFAAEDVRQWSREFRERRAEAERLRQDLEREGVGVADFDAIVDRLRRLESGRGFSDPRGLAELQARVIEGLKEFEYALRRQVAGDEGREPLLTGSDEVPAGYRELVEEYYRALAEQPRN